MSQENEWIEVCKHKPDPKTLVMLGWFSDVGEWVYVLGRPEDYPLATHWHLRSGPPLDKEPVI